MPTSRSPAPARAAQPKVAPRLTDAAGRLFAWTGRLALAIPRAARGQDPAALAGWLGMTALMVVLTLVKLRQFALHLDRVPDLFDPLFSIWRIAWVAHQLPRDPANLYDANIFWPERNTLAYSDGIPLIGATAMPFIWLGGSPATVYAVFALASFVLCGLGMYGLVRSLTGRALPAVVSGVLFAFYPFRFEHFLHIELLSAFWMPLALWALHKTLTDRARRWRTGLLTGAAVAAQYLSGMYFGVFLASVMLVMWGVFAVARRGRAIAAMPLLAGAILAGALIAPTLPPYMQVRNAVGERTRDEVKAYSAEPRDYITVEHWLRRTGGCNERQVFPGFLIVPLALAALWPPVSAARVAWVAGLVAAFDISLGFNGVSYPFLYEWLLPFRGLRAPARSAMLVGLALSVLAGFGTARLTGLLRGRWKQALLAAALCGITLAEPRPEVGVLELPRVPPVYGWFAGRPASTIVEMPFWLPTGAQYLYYSTSHWQRLVNGFSGAIPEWYRPFHAAMQRFPDEETIALLRSAGVSYAVVHEEFYGKAAYRGMIERIEHSPSLALVSSANDGRFEARIYKLLR